MYKYVIALFLVILSTHTRAQVTVNDPNAEIRKVGSFHSLHISNAFDVIITQGNEESLAVSANDKEDISRITTSVSDGVLKIGFDNKGNWWPNNRKLKAYISIKSLKKLAVSGASKVKTEGRISTDELQLDLGGASKIIGTFAVSGKLDVDLGGASDLNITGNAGTVKIEASGASDFDGYDFTTSSCDVSASGASTVRITAEKDIVAKLRGASKLSYKGSASIKDISTSGASSVSRKS